MASWLNNAIFYEVYPQSFNDTNSDGIGDFQGIINKLDYISNLGCNAIWINPCFDSSFYDAGYDVRDYYATAERYGTNEDLHRLFDRAHEFDMHVLLDLVPGHTAIDNPWFLESGKGTRNAWTDRYIWRPMTQSPNLNSPYESIRGFLGGIAERPDAAAVNCFSTQACLNYGFGTVTEDWQFAADSPEAQEGRLLIQNIMDFWLGLGADGFRVDMAGSLVKEDPDYYWLWRQVRAHLDETHPDAVLVSEWGDPVNALHSGFDMDFLLHFGPSHYLDLFRENPYFSASANGDIKAFVDTYQAMLADTKGLGYICVPSGNHDMIRMRDTLTPGEMKLAFAFLLTLPGCPFIYYGDEIGMRYEHGLLSKEGGYERTGSRTPMQWQYQRRFLGGAQRRPVSADRPLRRPSGRGFAGRRRSVAARNGTVVQHLAAGSSCAAGRRSNRIPTCRGPCPPTGIRAQRRRRANRNRHQYVRRRRKLHAARRLRGPACARRRPAGDWRRGGPLRWHLAAYARRQRDDIRISRNIRSGGISTKSRNAPLITVEGSFRNAQPYVPSHRSHHRHGEKSSCKSMRSSIAVAKYPSSAIAE